MGFHYLVQRKEKTTSKLIHFNSSSHLSWVLGKGKNGMLKTSKRLLVTQEDVRPPPVTASRCVDFVFVLGACVV
jgi:hypothetical protein